MTTRAKTTTGTTAGSFATEARAEANIDLSTGQWERPETEFVKPAPPLAGARTFEAGVDVDDIAWDDFGIYDPDDEIDPPGDYAIETVEYLAERYAAGEPVDLIQVTPGQPGTARRFDLHDGWHRIQAARLVGITHLDVIVIDSESHS